MAGNPPDRHDMTAQQFDALAELIRMRPGPSREAARLVLVDGAPLKLAASAAGITVGGTSNAVQRVRRALGLAKIAAGLLVCS
jgi:DNA-directed RNA polymerase specialized sigma24 family protein